MKEQLYTARYFILKQMPEGVAKVALLAALRTILGPEPAWYSPQGEDAPEVLPDLDEADAPDAPPVPAGLRVAIVVGHNSSAPGAWLLPPVSESEYVYNNKVADRLVSRGLPGVELRKFNRVPTSRGYNAEIATVYAEVNRWAPHLVVEMHFNGGRGSYTVMLAAKGSARSVAVARAFQSVFVDALGTSDAGVWERTRGERGGASLFAAKAPMTLTEPFFGDNPQHAQRVADLGYDRIAEIYGEAVKAALVKLYEEGPAR